MIELGALIELTVFVLLSILIFLVAGLKLVWSYHSNGLFMLKKKVGINYWGTYAHRAKTTCDDEIKLPKPSRIIESTAGSAKYASGSAVKSAR